MLVTTRAAAQFGLVQLPLSDPAYVQLTALDHLGCPEAHISDYRPYNVRAIRFALAQSRGDPHCNSTIAAALRARFGVRDDTNAVVPRSEASAKEGLRAGAAVTVRLTGLSNGEFEPMWEDERPTGQGDPAAVGIVHGRLTWGDGSDEHVVAVGDAYVQSNSRNDPTIRNRQFRSTSAVIDFSEAYAAVRFGPFEGTIGRGQDAWLGEGTESIVLSANGPPMDRITMGLKKGPIEARVLFGSLDDVVMDSAQDGVVGGPQPQRYYRYLAVGAVTWKPTPKVEATVGQLGLFPVGTRTLDLFYVIPTEPYPDTSRTLANVANHLATFGAVRVHAGPATLDGEVFVDEAAPTDKFAYSLSASTPIPTRIPVAVTATYERIGADVYESPFYASTLQRYNAPIGSELGPDADYAKVGAEVFAAAALRISGDIGIWRRGSVRIDDRPSEPLPATDLSQHATIGNISVQFLTPVLPVTLRFQMAHTSTTTYGRTQFIGTYAFRYP